MVEVVDILNREVTDLQILPIFMSVDPRRDTVERVKKYYAEFSPKLRGYTGSKEQVLINNFCKVQFGNPSYLR